MNPIVEPETEGMKRNLLNFLDLNDIEDIEMTEYTVTTVDYSLNYARPMRLVGDCSALTGKTVVYVHCIKT